MTHNAETDTGRAGLGALVERLIDEHWPNSGVNPWYLADLLREHGVSVGAGIDAPECERCEGTGDLYGRTSGPIALCPECSGCGIVRPEVSAP